MCLSVEEQGYRSNLRFRNTNTLPFTTTNTADKVISNLRINSVGKTEHCHDNVSHMRSILRSCNARDSVSRSWTTISMTANFKIGSRSYHELVPQTPKSALRSIVESGHLLQLGRCILLENRDASVPSRYLGS